MADIGSSAMNIEQTYAALKSAYTAGRSSIVPLLIGLPGIGKTQSVYKLASELGVKVVEINANQAMPSEISGMAMPSHEQSIMEYYDDSLLMSLEDGDILFFDEVLTAPSVVLNAFLKLLMDRRLRSGKLLPDVFIVAAGNMPKTGLREFTAPQLQRFMPINMRWDPKEWRTYCLDRYGDERLPSEMSTEWKDIVSLVKRELDLLSQGNYSTNNVTPRRAVEYMDWVLGDPDGAELAIGLLDGHFEVHQFLGRFAHPKLSARTQLEIRLEEMQDIFKLDFSNMDPADILQYAQDALDPEEFERFKEELASVEVE